MFSFPKADDESTNFFLTLPHSAKKIFLSEACSMPAKRKRHNSFVLPKFVHRQKWHFDRNDPLQLGKGT